MWRGHCQPEGSGQMAWRARILRLVDGRGRARPDQRVAESNDRRVRTGGQSLNRCLLKGFEAAWHS